MRAVVYHGPEGKAGRKCRTQRSRRILWIKGVTITTGLVDTYSTPTLLRLIQSGQLEVGRFVTHRFALDQIMDAYDVFSRAGATGALNVVLSRS